MKSIIIPHLLADLLQGSNKQKMIALAALNRFNSLLGEDERVISIFEELVKTGFERDFVLSVIRAAGSEGENLLLKLAKEYSEN